MMALSKIQNLRQISIYPLHLLEWSSGLQDPALADGGSELKICKDPAPATITR
jgi:hypothetical protein